MKVAENSDGVIMNIHPEYDDIKNAALKHRVSPVCVSRHVMVCAERILQSEYDNKCDTNG